MKRKLVAALFIGIALVLGVLFYMALDFPLGIDGYFKPSFYNQLGPLAISIELLYAGYCLFVKHPKTNFVLAVFAFTALLDPLFSLTGLFTTSVPLYASILFVLFALVALWLAFTNTFNLGRISFLAAFGSFILGSVVELFFNLWMS
ncbi:hypothetical protein [Croceitalea rosinachiae]|uniref:Uncharacterized protein n=1 Tax=Croceitalea rosinachiae TaxID=3075596 RepID=A0ABU3A9H4_9FLAO|nr:hypothetical protein [Croceitalea sp. F388]MDT0606852.1 hypothetical protein [Croceitalea sp. F388]